MSSAGSHDPEQDLLDDVASTKDDDAAERKRKCTAKGREFFLAQCLKGRDKLQKKILDHVGEVERLLGGGSLEDARREVDALTEVHEEFVRKQLRYRELLSQQEADVSQEDVLSDDVMQRVKAVKAKVDLVLAAKNSEKSRKATLNLIEDIQGLLEMSSLEEAHKITKTLDEVHEEFVRSHVDYRQMLFDQGGNVSVAKDVSDDILQRVSSIRGKVASALSQRDQKDDAESRDNLRRSIYTEIQRQIQGIQDSIQQDDFFQADSFVVKLDDLFGDFMSASNPTKNPEVNALKDGEFTDLVDSAVFTAKKSLAEAKSKLEVGIHSNNSLTNASPKENNLTTKFSIPGNVSSSRKARSGRSSERSYVRSSRHGSPHSSCNSRKSHHSRTSRHGSRKHSPARSNRSHSSGSSHSSNASSRSARDKAIEEKARLAALMVESKYLEQSQRSMLEKQKLDMESERLDIEREIAIAEAKSRVYEEHVEIQSNGSSRYNNQPSFIPRDLGRCSINMNHPSHPNPLNNDSSKMHHGPTPKIVQNQSHPEQGNKETNIEPTIPQHQTNHLNDLCNLLKMQSAPDIDMDVFTGDPLDYQYFMSLFEELIEKKVDDPLGRLARLIKYTRGEAKELIQHCIQMPLPEGYYLAKELLQKEYGDPHKVTAAYMKELRTWKPIKGNDVKEMKKFYRFLLKCNTNRKGDTYLTLLDNPETLRILQTKLPSKMQDKWTRKAVYQREAERGELKFADLLDFVKLECKVLDDPLYGDNRDESRGNEDDIRKRKPFEKEKTFKTNLEEGKESAGGEKLHEACLYCADRHDIDSCPKFLELTHRERRSYLFAQKICFYCYETFVSTDHGYNKCKNRRLCKTCKEPHPTAMHKDKEPEGAVETTRATHTTDEKSSASDSDSIGMPIVPVKLYHDGNPEKYLIVYAMLDLCSTGTFVLQDVVEQMDVPLEPVTVKIKTIIGDQYRKMRYVNEDEMIVESIAPGQEARPIRLPRTYCKKTLPVEYDEIVTIDSMKKWDYLDKITEVFHRYKQNIPIGLIIGGNCPKPHQPVDVIPSQDGGPFALCTTLGWCVVGPCKKKKTDELACHHIQVEDVSTNLPASHKFVLKKPTVQDVTIGDRFKEMYMNDFNENHSEKKALSVEDNKFLEIMQEDGKLIENRHHLPLPLRNKEPMLPNNRSMAVKRLKSVKNKMLRDTDYRNSYVSFMESMFNKGQARKVDPQTKAREGMVWYVPHHGVYHPRTKKFRTVMDCSAEFDGRSLNSELLQGPDNTNLLLGVFLRFREYNIPFMGDLEQMFFQIFVSENQRSLLRFLWWKDGDVQNEPEDYEMCVHLFGAVSSPSVAGYALRKTAVDNIDVYGPEAANAILRNFYVDDLLKSMKTEEDALKMIDNISKMCASGSFNLTKLVSSNRQVLNNIPIEKRAKDYRNFDFSHMGLPTERALGMVWHLETDSLGFRSKFLEKPLSRKVILTDVMSAYDLDGRASAFTLPGKKVLQELTAEKKGWDEEVSTAHTKRYEEWKSDMALLEDIDVPRCFTPADFGDTVSRGLHCFSDASETGYGQVSYLRSVNADGKIHVSQVTAKARVAPLKSITIPRLELTAGTVSVKVAAMLQEELDFADLPTTYWTDSNIVLGYINNEGKRFRTYVANRLNLIHTYSSKDQWRYVNTDDNPADYASRGLSPKCESKVRVWFDGPDFLWMNEEHWPANKVDPVEDDDVEVKPSVLAVNKILVVENAEVLTMLELRFSSWYKLVRVLAHVFGFIHRIKRKIKARKEGRKVENLNCIQPLNVADVQQAAREVIKLTQQKYMHPEFEILGKLRTSEGKVEVRKVRRSSTLSKLDPFISDEGIIRVGGRLRKSSQKLENVCPMVIPKNSPASILLIREAHEEVAHCGRCATLNKLRSNGVWVVGASSAIKKYIDKCRRCRELRGKASEQKMADLPEERVVPSPPFTHCGADMFGPFVIKQGRSLIKRYGCIFTCMALRAVHIECTSDLSADALIQALRRFISRRGQVSSIRTDNGTNFVGAENELAKCLEEIDQEKVQEFLLSKGCDWIVWKKNPPTASHMGGVWERQIRSIRSILTALMKEHSTILTDESLRTFMAETEAIINSRPLTVETINDPLSPAPLSPIQLLTYKSDVVFPPPGEFLRNDVYCRRHWRRVQYLSNEFWSRWRVEFLSSLQPRQKWTGVCRNIMVGDIVLVKDSEIFTRRNGWPMARVEQVFPSDDGLVRKVQLRVAHKQADKTSVLERPINKLVLLVEADGE